MNVINKLSALAIVAAAGVASTAAQAQAPKADNYYFSIGANASRPIYDMSFQNPRITGKVSGPTTPSDTTLSLALGKSFGDGWRGEIEFVAPSKNDYDSYWNPFPLSLQKVTIDTHRLMVNGIKDFPMSKDFSLNASFGLGWASVKTSGVQGTARDPFASKTNNNLAYSLGVGAEYKFDTSNSVTLGLRRVELGKAESGMSQFAPNDERFKGKIRSDELSIAWKHAF